MTPYLTLSEITTYATTPGLTMMDVNIATATIDSYMGRSFAPTTYTEQAKLTKKIDGYYGQYKGKLKHFPRVSITSVSAQVPSPFGGLVTTTYDPSCLFFDGDDSLYFTFVKPAAGYFGITVNPSIFVTPIPRTVTVEYISGYPTIPDEIKYICGMVMDNIAANGGTVPWKSRDDFNLKVTLSDKEDPVMSNGIVKLLNLWRLS